MHQINSQLSSPAKIYFSKWGQFLFWGFTYLLIVFGFHCYISYPLDGDTAYHFVVGRLIREYGILDSFPWTPFSWLANNYADKEFLFHLLFVPFTDLGYITASRAVGALCGATILVTIYIVLRSERIPFAGLWAMLPLVISVSFLYRFALIRPHLLSIALSLFFLLAAARKRLVLLAIVSTLYPVSYVAFWQIPLLLLVCLEFSRFISGEKVQWSPAAVAFAGIAFGIAIHPNALFLMEANWIQMSNVLFQNAWGANKVFDLGQELASPTFMYWQHKVLLTTIVLFISLFISWKNRKKESVSLSFALSAVAFCSLALLSTRFVEYLVPFTVASMALSSRYIRLRFFLPGLFCISVIYMFLWGMNTLHSFSTRGNDMPISLSKKLQQLIPLDSQVFTPDWRMTGTFLMALPDRKFIVALDPTFLYMNDPELYRLWYTIPRKPSANFLDIIRTKFNSRYILFFVRPEFKEFHRLLHFDPRARLLYRSRIMYLYDIGN